MNKRTLDLLTDEYQDWCRQEGLEPMSADDVLSELTAKLGTIKDQILYLKGFLKRWETATDD